MTIRIVERIGSTNASLLADTLVAEGDWLVALRQDAGKGRQGRTWEGLDGNFFGSTLIRLREADPPPHTLAMVAGLALLEAVEGFAADAPFCLKWPNDLMLDEAKLAGILLERADDRIVAGFGVNLAVAPRIEGRKTASLDARVSPQDFAPTLADAFARLLGAWRMAEPSTLIRAWEARAHPAGTPLTVHTSESDRMAGTFEGLEPDGALRLRKADGSVEIVRTGDVFFR